LINVAAVSATFLQPLSILTADLEGGKAVEAVPKR